MESSLGRIVGRWYLVKVKTDLFQVEQACEKQSRRAQAQPVPKQFIAKGRSKIWPKVVKAKSKV